MAGEVAIDSGEKRLNELGYKQELRREMVRFFSFTTAPSFFLSVSLLDFNLKMIVGGYKIDRNDQGVVRFD